MIGTYWQKFGGRVRLDQIMDNVGTIHHDLPFLKKHADVNGRNKLCWNGVLGHCKRPNWTFTHEKGEYMPDDFIKETYVKLE